MKSFNIIKKQTISPLVTVLLFFVLVFPLSASALTCTAGNTDLSSPANQNFGGIVCFVLGYVNQILVLLVAGSLLAFVWGVAKFILASGDEKKIEEGKTLMIWGVIALFVMVSIWGIIQLFYSDIFGGSIGVPTLPETT